MLALLYLVSRHLLTPPVTSLSGEPRNVFSRTKLCAWDGGPTACGSIHRDNGGLLIPAFIDEFYRFCDFGYLICSLCPINFENENREVRVSIEILLVETKFM